MLTLTFSVEEKQVCSNCRAILNIDVLYRNLIGLVEDENGIPEVMVYCSSCNMPTEWQMRMH